MKTDGLVLCLSSLIVLLLQGCTVDASHLGSPSDGASVHGDGRPDGAVTANPDSLSQDSQRPPNPVVSRDAAPEGKTSPDVPVSAGDAGRDSRDGGATAADGARTVDTESIVEGGAREVAGFVDSIDGFLGGPDASGTVDMPPAQDLIPDLAPDVAPDVPPTVVNLSQGKPPRASSEQPGKEAIFGDDGAKDTSFCGANASFPTWWRVDLGATFNIVRTESAFERPGQTYLYRIEVSNDDSNYTTVVDRSASSERAGVLETDTFTAQARYVRIIVLGISPAGAAPACLSEVSVWGYASPGSPAATLTNLALAGTAYRWYGNADATSNSNRIAESKLNDDSVSPDVSLAGDVYPDGYDDYEAAGVILPRASTIASVVFVNGATLDPPPFFPGDPDGNFTDDFHLQLSTDGVTWSDAEGWRLAPAYPNDASASNRAYVFSGSATGVVGVRVTGLIHPDDTKSAYARARELQVWGPATR